MPKKTSSGLGGPGGPGSSGASPGGWRYVYAVQLLNQAIQEFEAIGALEEARPLFQTLMEILVKHSAQKTLGE